jgi:hypothetical protein
MNTEINEIKTILELIQTLNEYKFKLRNISDDISKKIIHYENILIKLCNHEWEIDYSYNTERTQYQCKICKLYK